MRYIWYKHRPRNYVMPLSDLNHAWQDIYTIADKLERRSLGEIEIDLRSIPAYPRHSVNSPDWSDMKQKSIKCAGQYDFANDTTLFCQNGITAEPGIFGLSQSDFESAIKKRNALATKFNSFAALEAYGDHIKQGLVMDGWQSTHNFPDRVQSNYGLALLFFISAGTSISLNTDRDVTFAYSEYFMLNLRWHTYFQCYALMTKYEGHRPFEYLLGMVPKFEATSITERFRELGIHHYGGAWQVRFPQRYLN